MAAGLQALYNNTTGSFNTASGVNVLYHNTAGINNTATGLDALYTNTTGSFNTASGYAALFDNTFGVKNTANGYGALYGNTDGGANTAEGYFALFRNSSGSNNVAIGTDALFANSTGFDNMANGSFALFHNTTGNYNVAEGLNALFQNTTGSNNIGIGLGAGDTLTTGGGNIDIGNEGVADESSTIRIGSSQSRAFLAGVRNAVASGGVAVYATATGQLGTNPSSKRFKEDIADMNKQSEAVLALRPVTFHYKEELDPNKIAQFGLIAEEVARINPNLVARDDKGEIYSVRYEAVNATLLNEFLKEHRKVDRLEETVAQLKSALKEQAAQIQQVSEQMALQKTRVNLVADDR